MPIIELTSIAIPFGNADRKEQPRLVIDDKEKRKRIVSTIHDAGHMGIHRTSCLIAKKYYWPGMYKDISDYVSIVFRTLQKLLVYILFTGFNMS